MQESPELAAARQREQAAKERWQPLYRQLIDLQSQLERLAAQEQAAYQSYTEAAEVRSRIERQAESALVAMEVVP